MSAKRREWTRLILTLTGAGIGQWIWLTQKWHSLAGFTGYFVALTSWLDWTRAAPSRPPSDRRVRLAWMNSIIFGSLALLVGMSGPERTPLALFLMLVALAYVILGLGRSRGWTQVRHQARNWPAMLSQDWVRQPIRTTYQRITSHPIQTVLITGSLLIIAGSGLAAHRGIRTSAHLVSLGAWALGLTLYVLAFTPRNPSQALARSLRELFTAHRLETVAVLALWGIAMALRTINLEQIPAILTGDEGAMGVEAVRVLKGQQVNPFSTGWTSHPTLYFYILALFLRLFGQGITALRLASALAGAFTIPITYLLVRHCFNKTVALVSALFLTGYHLHIHYSRLALNNVWAPLAAVLTFLCLWLGLRTRRSWLCALGGIAMGLGQYTYFGARLLPVIVILWLFFLRVNAGRSDSTVDADRPEGDSQPPIFADNGARLLIFWLGFLLTLLPLTWFFLEHWNAFTARIAQVGLFGSQGVDPAREGYFAPLATGLFKSLLAFNLVRDRSIFYGPPLPLLHWLSGIFFVFGVAHAIRRWREPGHSLLLIWLLGTVIFGGALMNHPPESPRLLFTAPAVAILVALGLTQLSDLVSRVANWPSRGNLAHALVLTCALVATGVSAFYYLGVYTPSGQFGDTNTHLAHRLGIWARDLEPVHQVYFFGAPRMTYVGFPSIAFLAPDAHIQDVIEPIEQPLPVIGDTTFIFVPQRIEELDIIAAANPKGRRWTVMDDQGRTLFIAYQVDRET